MTTPRGNDTGHEPVSDRLGIAVVAASVGHAQAELTVTSEMLNQLGVLHGGVTFTLADTAMAYASNAGDESAVAVNADIDFLRPGQVGERLVATATRRAVAGRTSVYDVDVITDSGELLATFRGRTRTISGRSTQRSEGTNGGG